MLPLLFLAQSVSVICAQPVTRPQSAEALASFKVPSRKQVNHAIGLAGAYMDRACGPDGRFVYKVNVQTGEESSSYNIIRHAGAIYALGMLQQTHPSRATSGAMIRAAGYMRRNYIGAGVRSDMLVVWSKPTTTSSDAELGATGLGLVALAAVRKISPKSVPLADLQALGRFILFLQRGDGSFVSKYSPDGGPVAGFDSLYYPGEAALGLLSLYELDRSPVWLNAAGKALSYLARSRKGLAKVAADHWALIATARLLSFCNYGPCPVSREELLEHAVQVCTSMLRDQVRGGTGEDLDGAFDKAGRTTPAATRLEGLLAALAFLPEVELHNDIEIAVQHGITFLLRNQIVSGAYKGGMPGALSSAQDTSQVRIDYVQHTLSALAAYLNIDYGPALSPRKP